MEFELGEKPLLVPVIALMYILVYLNATNFMSPSYFLKPKLAIPEE